MKRLPLLLIGLGFIIPVALLSYWFIQSSFMPYSYSLPDGMIALVAGFIVIMAILLCSILWIGALVDLLNNKAIQGNDKIVWALVIIFLHLLGALIYILAAPKAQPVTIPYPRRFRTKPVGH